MSTGETMRNDKGHAQEIKRVKGRYANYFKVGHNAFEFVLDFGQSYADDEEARIHTRIVSSPNRAKALSNLLKECVKQYEANFGGIEEE